MHSSFENGVLTLTFDRPGCLNAVRAAGLAAMAGAIERAGDDPSVRVIVIAGQGRAFCSGADVGAGSDIVQEAGSTIDAANRLTRAITQSPRPVLAFARGVTAGVGVSIALACDLVLCDRESYFMLAFTRVGLMPDGGSTALVAASVGRTRAMRMALLAEKLPATEALEIGLVSRVWPAEDFEYQAKALVSAMVHGPAAALGRTKLAINQATLAQLETAYSIEADGQLGLLVADDFREGRAAFADRRPAQFADPPDVRAPGGDV